MISPNKISHNKVGESYAVARAIGLWIGSCSVARLRALALTIGIALTGFANVEAATVTRVYNGDASTATFHFTGAIRPGDLSRLQAQTSKVPAGQRIVLLLDSSGGSIDDGIAMGRYINTAKITTVAIQGPGCHSSCTFMFLAGRDLNTDEPSRIMVKGAKIGFHQGRLGRIEQKSFTADDVNAATQIGQDIVKQVNAYFNEIKVDPEFLTLFLSAPTTSLTFLNEFDALRLGIYVMEPISKKLIGPDTFKQQTTQR